MKKLMSLFAAILFAGVVFAGPKYTSECVSNWSWIGDKCAECANPCTFSVYVNPNACLMYLAVGWDGNCYDVKKEDDGFYYISIYGKWCKMK